MICKEELKAKLNVNKFKQNESILDIDRKSLIPRTSHIFYGNHLGF